MAMLWREIRGFWLRFWLVLGVVYVFPFPIGTIPKTEWLPEWLLWPLTKLIEWCSAVLLGITARAGFTNSGDRIEDYGDLLTLALLSLVVAIVWSVLDRKRTRYPRLEAVLLLGLRYMLAMTIIWYGLAKVFKSQMPDLRPSDLDTPLGELSPMGLAWAFIGFSTPYSIFAGMSEVLGGALLLWRRTQTLGALVVVAVMTNVVAMNLCFDIPVKLGSAQLLIIALILLAPVARRLLAAALGYAVPELPARRRLAPRWERARWVLALAILAAIPYSYVLPLTQHQRNAHQHELYGSWLVDEVSIDGAIRPPLTTDAERWSRVQMNGQGMWTVSMRGDRRPADLIVDATKHTLTRTPYENFDMTTHDHEVTETWTYQHADADQLILDGASTGHHWHVTLHRAPPSLLMTRGFHWINPNPFRARDRSVQ